MFWPTDANVYSYDVLGRMTWGADPNYGTALSATDYSYLWSFAYDTDGRMTKEALDGFTTGTWVMHPLGERKVQYDAAGRRTKQAFKSENRTGYLNLDTYQTYAYNSTKQWLSKIQRESSASEKADYFYDDTDGHVTKMSYGNGARAEYGYDASGALTRISHYNGSGTLIASVGYEYDAAGNVTKAALDDSLTYSGDATVSYEYDGLYRLTREYCAPAQGSYRAGYDYKYMYDAVGNRTKKQDSNGTTSYSYSARNELLSVWHSWPPYCLASLAYDLRGNLTKTTHYREEELYWGRTLYYWSSDDKLTKVEIYDDDDELTNRAEYKYDLLGRRVAKRLNVDEENPGPWRWYFYDGLQVETEGTGTNDKIYYTHSPSAIGGIITRDNNGTKYWYHFDRLGNVMAVTDSNGNLYAGYTMEAFGNTLEVGTSTGYSATQSDPQPYHLTTKEFDSDAGLYFFNARWYDAVTGRFVSRAPFPVEVEHPYTFCDNNPARFTDSNGMYCYKDCIRDCHSDFENSVKAANDQHWKDVQAAALQFSQCGRGASERFAACVAGAFGIGRGLGGRWPRWREGGAIIVLCFAIYTWEMNDCVDNHTEDMDRANERFDATAKQAREKLATCKARCRERYPEE